MCISMTGYGRSDFTILDRSFTLEVKSLNHRYLDVKLKMPERFFGLEEKVRGEIKKKFSRGHISLFIKAATSGGKAGGLNMRLVKAATDAAKELRAVGIEGEVDIALLLGMRDIFNHTEDEVEASGDWSALEGALATALDAVAAWRTGEGSELKDDISSRLTTIEGFAGKLEEMAPAIEIEYRARLTEKMEALVGDGVDEQRLLTEAAIIADKAAFDEEITRLASHTARFREYLDYDEPVGRRMDFLCQELLREINTTGSKVSDVAITRIVVEFKGELEKIREQVQNIE